MAKTNIRGTQIADGSNGVDLTVDVFNVLPVANGGTGASTLNALEQVANKNIANGYAGLDGSGLINSSQLPPLAITDTFVVASQAAMLALTAQTGDVAVRSDLNKSFILTASPASTLGNWQELLTPTDTVLSVFSRTGAVTATAGDYSATQITNTPAGNIAATTVQAALNELDNEKVVANAPITGATVGDATHVPIITYDTKGLITSSTTATISASGASETFAFFNGN